jgi:hypothetical protein
LEGKGRALSLVRLVWGGSRLEERMGMGCG